MLREALERYDELVSTFTPFGQNRDGLLSGQAIYEAHKSGDLEYTWMGRVRGLHGPELQGDLETGNWATRQYEVRREPLDYNPNWFPVDEFVRVVDDRQQASGTSVRPLDP